MVIIQGLCETDHLLRGARNGKTPVNTSREMGDIEDC